MRAIGWVQEIEQMKQKQFALVKRRSENDKQIRDMTNSVQFMEEIANQVCAHSSNLLLHYNFFFDALTGECEVFYADERRQGERAG